MKIYLLVLCALACSLVHGQEITLSGTVKDSLNTPLANANILAFPTTDTDKVRFAISDQKGRYTLKLAKAVSYTLEVSYIGFTSYTATLTAEKDLVKDIILQPAATALDEVVLTYKIPVTIKKDTIIYNPEAFVTGKERKLREMLKKLPGVEVDREGNVLVKGKEVNTLLVDDRTFFTGDTKLGVNNIPADVVDKIEVYENYSAIPFLKGLEDSDKTALNVKLKKDKKRFTFGDIEAGAGIEDRYAVHPNIFYYAPKTNINFIGDLNNTGEKSFTLRDFFNFEGGFQRLFGKTANTLGPDLTRFLLNEDFTALRNQFGALNIRQDLSPKTTINAYAILNDSRIDERTVNENQFINTDQITTENREATNNSNTFFALGKMALTYQPGFNEDLSVTTFIKASKGDQNGDTRTTTGDSTTRFNTRRFLDVFDLTQNVGYNKKFSRAQTLKAEATFTLQKNRPDNRFTGDIPFLEASLPLEPDPVTDVFQESRTDRLFFDVFFKNYWVLNNTNHIYTSIGTQLTLEDYFTRDGQRLSDNGVNEFEEGFGNNVDYRLHDTFLGVEYKMLLGVFTLKTGLFFHHYQWQNRQLGQEVVQRTNLLLPEAGIEVELSNIEQLTFNYKRDARFPQGSQLAQNFTLLDFNQLFRGDAALQHDRSHLFTLNYSKFNLLKGTSFKAFTNYTLKTQNIKNASLLEGINQVNTVQILGLQEKMLSTNIHMSKTFSKIKYGIKARASYNDFFQIVNNVVSKNISKRLSAEATIATRFKKFPNVEAGYRYEPSRFQSERGVNNFITQVYSFDMEYTFLRDFTLKGDYERTNFSNTSGTRSIYDLANVSLFYQKEDSPWGFELSCTNILNTTFRRQSSFSNILISDQRIFILPRIIMAKVSFKL
ncbi:carboxypeptidase-like regulatory domain-containing protein [Ascidiimonas aurantiaca]|uniref:carboxypeptidase-like regulatory domain-containing protein n=1 Tax=Ascidiimonas aurantiaca TaxID=1685432 RepID=UPI0030EBA357